MKKQKYKINWANYLYWILVSVILTIQIFYVSTSIIHIRQEELTESVSTVYWLQNFRQVCSGLTTNIGWYAQLMLVYNLFGFSLWTIKIYKLTLFALSLFCLASLLKKYLGEKIAWFPLLTIGFSPTLLYFNSLSIHFGSDLLYFPITLFLLVQIKFEQTVTYYLKQSAFFGLLMLAWMSYPTFIYYLPLLIIFYLYRFLNSKSLDSEYKIKTFVINFLTFLAPFIIGFLFVKNKDTLIYNPGSGAGIFRGNGGISFDPKIILENLQTVFSDLFLSYSSYYFEIAKVEFSDFYPVISILTVFIVCIYFCFKTAKFRKIILFLFIYLVASIILNAISGPIGGMRRATNLLAIFYILFCFSIYFLSAYKKFSKEIKYLLYGLISLILLHHILVFPTNLNFLKQPSNYREGAWFYQAENPQKSLDMYLEQIQKTDLSLVCLDEKGNPSKCQRFGYNLIYPAIAGSCLWNGLNCNKIKIFDFNKKEMVPLNLECWRDDL